MPNPAPTTLRRPDVPRLVSRRNRLRGSDPPGFLTHPEHHVPIHIDPIIGPLDRLETAIAQGHPWQEGDRPVDIAHLDRRAELLSVIIENGSRAPVLDLRAHKSSGATHLLADGKTLARIEHTPAGFSLSDVMVLNRTARG